MEGGSIFLLYEHIVVIVFQWKGAVYFCCMSTLLLLCFSGRGQYISAVCAHCCYCVSVEGGSIFLLYEHIVVIVFQWKGAVYFCCMSTLLLLCFSARGQYISAV